MFLNSNKITFNSTSPVLIHFQHRVGRTTKVGNKSNEFNFKIVHVRLIFLETLIHYGEAFFTTKKI